MPDEKKGLNQGGAGTPGTEESKETPPPQGGEETPPPTPTPPEYRNPRLKGKSVEEIDRLVSTFEDTVREQSQRLSSLEREKATRPTAPAAPAEKPDFFADPYAAMKRAMDEEIAPLRAELKGATDFVGRREVRQQMRERYGDWDQVEPYVDQLLAKQNFPDPNDPGLLETLYYTAVGVMTRQGSYAPTPGGRSEPPPREGDRPAAPPQHRASPPPPPPPPAPPGGGKTPPRQLTESEKRLAREYKMSEGEYLQWQDAEAEDVPMSNIGIPEEGKK